MHQFRRRRVLFAAVTSLAMLAGAAQQPQISPQEHARRANEYLLQQQPDKAIPELAALVEQQPDNVDAQANLGVLLYFQGHCSEAERYLRAAVKLDAQQHKIQALLGLCEYQLGKAGDSRESLSASVMNLTDPQFRKQVGLVLVEIETAQHDLAAAATTLNNLQSLNPEDPDIMYAAYRTYSDLAAESLLNLSLVAPDSARMQQAIAHELDRVRDHAGTIASYRRAIAKEPNLSGIHFELAEVLNGSNDQTERKQAVQEYTLALEKNPHEVMAAVRLGDIHAYRGEFDVAESYYNRALKLQPNNVDAALGLSRIFNDRSENDKELQALQRVLANDPANLMGHYRLMNLYMRLHQLEKAKYELSEYQKYKAIKDGLREIYGNMHIRAPHNAADIQEEKDGAAISH